MPEYDGAIHTGHIPVSQGVELNNDDKLRRDIINLLICDFRLDIVDIEHRYPIDFAEYFHDIYPLLEQFAQDSLLQYNWDYIEILPAGRLMVRTICMAFDKYSQSSRERFSKVI